MRSGRSKIFGWVYFLAVSGFLIGVLAQVFLAGLNVVARQTGWESHRNLGHALGIPLILMFVSMFPAKVSLRDRWLSGLLLLVYFIQANVVIFMRDSAPEISALHPVLALFNFLLAYYLLRHSLRIVLVKAEDPELRMSTQGSLSDPKINPEA